MDGKITYEKEIIPFKKWMLQKRYSVNTINTYSDLLLIFFKAIRKDIIAISQKDIILFNQEYILKKGFSATY